jgi:hypothetical protein
MPSETYHYDIGTYILTDTCVCYYLDTHHLDILTVTPHPQACFLGMKVRASSSVQVRGMLNRIKMSEMEGREDPSRRIGMLTQGPTLQFLYDR